MAPKGALERVWKPASSMMRHGDSQAEQSSGPGTHRDGEGETHHVCHACLGSAHQTCDPHEYSPWWESDMDARGLKLRVRSCRRGQQGSPHLIEVPHCHIKTKPCLVPASEAPSVTSFLVGRSRRVAAHRPGSISAADTQPRPELTSSPTGKNT